MHIGKRFEQIMKQKGMNQKAVAEKSGYTQANISKLTNKEVWFTNTLERICAAIDITPAQFYSGEYASDDDPVIGLVKEIGVDYLSLSKFLKDENVSPEQLKTTIPTLKSLGLLK